MSCGYCDEKNTKVTRKVNNTVCVDSVYGSDITGKVETPTLPFKTIKKAIKAIPAKSIGVDLRKRWTVMVAPGLYKENFVLPAYVKLVGAGVYQTNILGRILVDGAGFNELTQFSLSYDKPESILKVNLSSKDVNGPVIVQNVNISATLPKQNVSGSYSPVVLEQVAGINGLVNFNLVNVVINADNLNIPDISLLKATGLEVNITTSSLKLLASPVSTNKLISADNARVNIDGGLVYGQIPGFATPTANVIFYQAKFSSFSVQGGSVVGLYTPVQGDVPNKGDNLVDQTIILVYNDNSNVTVTSSNANFNGVPSILQKSVYSENSNSNTLLGSVVFAGGFVPALLGNTENVSLAVFSSQGNVVSNGGQNSNIVNISDVVNPESEDNIYYVQDNDSTIVYDKLSSADTIVFFEDPSVVNNEVVYTGKIVKVVNNTSKVVTLQGYFYVAVEDVEASVNPSVINLPPNYSIIFQAQKDYWIKTGLSPLN